VPVLAGPAEFDDAAVGSDVFSVAVSQDAVLGGLSA